MALDIVEFWQRVNDCIRLKGFTQDSLSLQCGFSKRRIENLSSGKRLPDVYEAYLIATALETTVEYLITGTNPQKEKFKKFQADLSDLIENFKG